MAAGGDAGPAATDTGLAAARAMIVCHCAVDSVVALCHYWFPDTYRRSVVGLPKSGRRPTGSITMQ